MPGGAARTSQARGPRGAASAFLRVALVGPTHQGAGRAARHTVALAHQLARAGHDVTLVSWSSDDASTTDVRTDAAEPFPRTVRSLVLGRPDTWLRTGRRLRGYDAVLVVHTSAAMVPLTLTLLRGAGIRRPAREHRSGPAGPRGVLVCDAVAGLHSRRATRHLLAALLSRVHGVLLHHREETSLAARLGAVRVYAVEEPDSLAAEPERAPSGRPSGPSAYAVAARGARASTDLLATSTPMRRAMAAPSTPAEPGHAQPTSAQPTSAQPTSAQPTSTQPTSAQHALAHARPSHSTPAPGLEDHLPGHSAPVALSAEWAAYVGAIETLAGTDVAAADLPETDTPGGAGRAVTTRRGPASRALGAVHATALLAAPARALAAAHRVAAAAAPRVELHRADLPDWVRPTDALHDAWQAEEALDEARRLGLPRARDGIAAWAALGALAAVVRLADDGRRAVLVDESGPESPLSRWARVCGFAPVDLGVTVLGAGPGWASDAYRSLDVDAGSLDVLVRVHPGGCDASDVDEVLAQAGWALRPGGLVVVTLPLGSPGTDLALGPADVRAVVARAGDHGLTLVGDLDGEMGRRLRAASRAAEVTNARTEGAAYGLVRLALRRR